MIEYLNKKEKKLLDFIYNHYKTTLEVFFVLFPEDYDKMGVTSDATLYNLLLALKVRGYIDFFKNLEEKETPTFPIFKIQLSNKSLNLFNSGKYKI